LKGYPDQTGKAIWLVSGGFHRPCCSRGLHRLPSLPPLSRRTGSIHPSIFLKVLRSQPIGSGSGGLFSPAVASCGRAFVLVPSQSAQENLNMSMGGDGWHNRALDDRPFECPLGHTTIPCSHAIVFCSVRFPIAHPSSSSSPSSQATIVLPVFHLPALPYWLYLVL
jgi:hypothetical protein